MRAAPTMTPVHTRTPDPVHTPVDDVQIAAGSVAGRHHRLRGANGQDALHWAREGAHLVAVVSDGCGSGAHSEVGARLGASLAVRALLEALRDAPGADAAGVLEAARLRMLEPLRALALALHGDPGRAVLDHLLFTLVGAAVGPERTFTFALGDGYVFVDGREHRATYPGNAPPYLAYALLEDAADGGTAYPFRVVEELPTAAWTSILLATDGLEDWVRHVGDPLPGRREALGPVSRFWEDARLFRNPFLLGRLLEQAARDARTPGRTLPGRLGDDTTVLVLRRPC